MNGHLGVLELLVSNQTNLTADNSSQSVATEPQSLVEELHSKRPDFRLHWFAADKAASQDHFEVVEWMEKHEPDLVYNWIYRALERHRDQAKNAYSNTDDVMKTLYTQKENEESDDDFNSES